MADCDDATKNIRSESFRKSTNYHIGVGLHLSSYRNTKKDYIFLCLAVIA